MYYRKFGVYILLTIVSLYKGFVMLFVLLSERSAQCCGVAAEALPCLALREESMG